MQKQANGKAEHCGPVLSNVASASLSGPLHPARRLLVSLLACPTLPAGPHALSEIRKEHDRSCWLTAYGLSATIHAWDIPQGSPLLLQFSSISPIWVWVMGVIRLGIADTAHTQKPSVQEVKANWCKEIRMERGICGDSAGERPRSLRPLAFLTCKWSVYFTGFAERAKPNSPTEGGCQAQVAASEGQGFQ